MRIYVTRTQNPRCARARAGTFRVKRLTVFNWTSSYNMHIAYNNNNNNNVYANTCRTRTMAAAFIDAAPYKYIVPMFIRTPYLALYSVLAAWPCGLPPESPRYTVIQHLNGMKTKY